MEYAGLPADAVAPEAQVPEPDEEVEVDENGEVPEGVMASIREARVEAQPFGRIKVIEVPGYHGLLAVEYQYIGAEITEAIARKVRRETRAVDGRGSNLLASIDTLRAACKRVLCRRDASDKEWLSVGGSAQPVVRLDVKLANLLSYDASDGREVVLGLFGSEHAIIQQNVILGNWLADRTRESDEDFLL